MVSCLRWLPLCLIGYVRRPTMSSLRRLLDESGASLFADSKTKRRRIDIPRPLGELWFGALLAAGETLVKQASLPKKEQS